MMPIEIIRACPTFKKLRLIAFLIAKVSCDCIIKFDKLIADIKLGEYGNYMDFFKHLQILNYEQIIPIFHV